MRRPEHGDGPTIGILLAATRDDVVVEYTVRGMDTPLAASTYTTERALPADIRTALPSAADLTDVVRTAGLPSRAPDRAPTSPWAQSAVARRSIGLAGGVSRRESLRRDAGRLTLSEVERQLDRAIDEIAEAASDRPLRRVLVFPRSRRSTEVHAPITNREVSFGQAVRLRLVRQVFQVVDRQAEPLRAGDAPATRVRDKADELVELAAADAGGQGGHVRAAGHGLPAGPPDVLGVVEVSTHLECDLAHVYLA